MSFFNRLRNIWDLVGSFSVADAVRGYDFMEFTGAERGNVTVYFDSLDGISDAYHRCSTLKTIANRNASAMINGKWWIVDKKDNDVIDKYKGIKSLLDRPNPLQTWKEFIIQLDVYRQIYGEVFVYAVVPVGFSVQDASALWVINPNFIDVNITGKLYMQSNIDAIVTNYYLNVAGERTKLEKSHVLCIKDTNQNIKMSSTDIRGKSRLLGLENSVRNIIQAEEAVYSLNKDRGAQGILSNESKDVAGNIPIREEEKETIQKEYQSAYGLGRKQRKIIISNANLKWQQMSFNVRDLMLFEGMENNIQRISDALDYPYELLSHNNGVTFANKLEAKRFHYQDNIIPLSSIYAEKFTSFFGLSRDKFFVDFSGVECLKKSETEQADTLYKQNQALKIAKNAGVISTAEWRLAIGMDEDIYKPDQEKENNNNQEEGNDNQGNQDTAEEGEQQE